MASVDIVPTSGSANGEGILQSPNVSFDTFTNARNGVSLGLTNPTGEFSYFLGFSGGQYYLARYFFKIDYSTLPTNANIQSVVLNFKARFNTDNSTNIEDFVLVQGNQGSTLATGDWGGVGTTSWGRYTGVISSFGTSSFRSLTLNATGKAAITPGSSVIEYAMVSGADFDNSAPGTGNAGPIMYTVTATSSADRPYVTVTYTIPGQGGSYTYFM